MSMTYHDKVFLAPLVRRTKPKPEPADDYGIGRSPRFVPGWWLAATGLFYAAVTLVCVFFLT
jgi:hypothetical protein